MNGFRLASAGSMDMRFACPAWGDNERPEKPASFNVWGCRVGHDSVTDHNNIPQVESGQNISRAHYPGINLWRRWHGNLMSLLPLANWSVICCKEVKKCYSSTEFERVSFSRTERLLKERSYWDFYHHSTSVPNTHLRVFLYIWNTFTLYFLQLKSLGTLSGTCPFRRTFQGYHKLTHTLSLPPFSHSLTCLWAHRQK